MSHEVRLPKDTVQLDTDNTLTSYSQILKLAHYKTPTQVIMKIGSENIQIITAKKQDLIFGLSCQLNDVFHISEIEDITFSSNESDNNEFAIKQNGRPSFTFTSQIRDTIIQAIRTSKARYQIAKPIKDTERILRPNDVPGTLLNMALFNIISEDPNLRLAAYNLLVSLSNVFNFDMGNQLLATKANNTNFVVGISEKLAASESRLTLDFLMEFFVGFNKSSVPIKHLCLQYMAPWLLNLGQFIKNPSGNSQTVDKTRDIIQKLIDLTARETNLYTTVQSKIWSTLAKVNEITDLIIDEFLQYAVEHGINSMQSETVANTIVTFSSPSIRGKVIAKLRKVIAGTSLKATRTLTDNPAWPEIAALVRFNLMLSFNDENIHQYLPELFYIVSILVATGPPIIRASIHGLIVNLVQSLCTSVPLEDSNMTKLSLLLNELSEPNYRYFFGLNNVFGNAFVISPESINDISDSMPLASLEKIVQALLDVMIFGSASAGGARWLGLVASTAFQHNPAIQPRAFVTLGCLAREEVDDDLLYQILVALRGALLMFTENDCLLIISIVMCLTNIVENLPSGSRYLLPLFWLAISLIQIGHVPIFPSAISLLQEVLRTLDNNNVFENKDIAKVLLNARIPLEEISIKMDSETGLNFEYFSFAIAATLLKGLKNPITKTGTQSLLMSFLDIASRVGNKRQNDIIDASMLGYLAALLPVSANNQDMKELLWLCGIDDCEIDNPELTTTYFRMYDKLDIPNDKVAFLLISLMIAILDNAENESEKLFLYGFLAETAKALPDVFSLVYDNLRPKLAHMINNCETISILDSVQSILYTIVSSETELQLKGSKKKMPSYLEELGFSNLMECGSFQNITKEKMKINALLA
ncbi:13584_t:CDS:2, partial [Entrophospora sp. SA101]